MTKEELVKAFRAFETDRLLKLLRIEAQKNHDGHYTIMAFTTNFKVAFGTPFIFDNTAYAQVSETPGFPTLKDAVINALVEAKSFEDYFCGDADEWERRQIPSGCPDCGSLNLRDRGSFDKCMDCGARFVPPNVEILIPGSASA